MCRPLFALALGGLLITACSEDTESLDANVADGGVDATVDSGVDVGFPDLGVLDGSFDAGRDAGPDAAQDAGFDGGVDGGFDSGADAGADAGFDEDAGADQDAAACSQKADCLPTGWCRDTAEGGMACTPWAAEGEFCGGFTAPFALSRCDPSQGVACNTAAFIPDAPGVCSIAATVDALVTTPGVYDGHVVALGSVFPVEGPRTCTPATPCDPSNGCSADLFVGDTVGAANVVALRAFSGNTPVECAGNECDYLDHCPQPVGMNALVVGRFRAATLSIEVQFFNAGF